MADLPTELPTAMPDTANSEAYVTLVTNDVYALGALVLSQSLRHVGTTRQLVVMFTPGVSPEMRSKLLYAFDVMVQVDVLDSQDAVNLELLTRPDLGVTFTKLHCWRLTQFTKCVFMDADTMVLQNLDELFEREELSAAPDVGWPDCFNSGVFVFRPSEETYSALLHLALTEGSFDGGDQGLLNSYFSDWSTKDINRHLPFVYNIVAHAFYSYLPAVKQFGHSTKVVHFIGPVKPWSLGYNTATGQVEGNSSHAAEFVNKWWKVFMEKIHYKLDGSLTSLVNIFERHPTAPHTLSREIPVCTPPPSPLASESHQMMTPYVPPEVPVFYDHTPQPHDSDVPEKVVEPESRPFLHFESFYTEPPMAQVESHPFAGEMYHAKEFSDVMTEYLHTSDTPLLPPTPISSQVEPAAEESAEEETWTVAEEIAEPTVDEGPAVGVLHSKVVSPLVTSESGVGDGDVVMEEDAPPAETDETKDNETYVEESVEQVSSEGSSNLIIYTKQQLSNKDRQFNWERGQIDYLGIDSFENILRHINGSIGESLTIKKPPAQVTTTPIPSAYNPIQKAPVHCSSRSAPVKAASSGQALHDLPTVESTDRGVTVEEHESKCIAF